MVQPGIHQITNYNYHNDPKYKALSCSGLKELHESPLAYFEYENGPKEPPSKAMVDGSAFHTFVLEPGRFDEEVEISKTVKKKDRDEAAADGVYMIDTEFMECMKRMRENLYKKDSIRSLLQHGDTKFEQSIFWKDRHDTPCKIRLDIGNEAFGVLADLKTSASAAPHPFRMSVYSYRYYIQDKFYLRGANTAGQFDLFWFIVCEKARPWDCAVYEIQDSFFERIQFDASTIDRLLDGLSEAQKTQTYNGYTDEIQTIT